MKFVWTELRINGFLEESFNSCIREKKKTLHIRSLIRSIGFIIEIIMKLPSLMTLMSSFMFNGSFGVKTTFIEFINKVWEVGRVLIQRPCSLNQVRVINTIWNQDTCLSFKPLLFIGVIYNVNIRPTNYDLWYLDPIVPSLTHISISPYD